MKALKIYQFYFGDKRYSVVVDIAKSLRKAFPGGTFMFGEGEWWDGGEEEAGVYTWMTTKSYNDIEVDKLVQEIAQRYNQDSIAWLLTETMTHGGFGEYTPEAGEYTPEVEELTEKEATLTEKELSDIASNWDGWHERTVERIVSKRDELARAGHSIHVFDFGVRQALEALSYFGLERMFLKRTELDDNSYRSMLDNRPLDL